MPCVPIFRKNGQPWLFRPNFPKNRFWGRNFITLSLDRNLHFQDTMCANFQLKRTTLTFLAQIFPKRRLGFEIQKTNIGIRISILKIPFVPIFRQNRQLWTFGPTFAQDWILGSKFQKYKSGFGINISIILCVPIFSQNGQLLISRPKFGEIAQ